jgi:gas vesicle protein
MMNKSLVVGLLVGGLVAGLAFAADSGDKKTSQDTKQLKKDYQRKVDKDLRDIGSKIRHLKHQALKAGDKLKADMNDQVKKLEAQKKEADRKFSELKKSAGDAWKDLRQGVDGAVTDLKKSVDEAAKQFEGKK